MSTNSTPIRDWIVATCQADPHIPSHRLQAAIDATFSITISIRYRNTECTEAEWHAAQAHHMTVKNRKP